MFKKNVKCQITSTTYCHLGGEDCTHRFAGKKHIGKDTDTQMHPRALETVAGCPRTKEGTERHTHIVL